MTSAYSRSRKGNAISDSIVIIVFLFTVSVAFFYAYAAFEEIKPTLDEEITDPTAMAMYTDLYDRTPGTLDSAVLVMLVLLWVGTLALSTMIDTHPIFMAMAVVVMVGVLIVGGIFSNTFVEMIEDAGVDADFPITVFIFEHFVAFILGYICTIFIALYAKRR